MNEIEKAKAILRDAGYFVDNLWTIRDVQDRFECDDNTAQDILNDALTNEYIVEQIFNTIISMSWNEYGLEKKITIKL